MMSCSLTFHSTSFSYNENSSFLLPTIVSSKGPVTYFHGNYAYHEVIVVCLHSVLLYMKKKKAS